jgi:cardiolipin synthase
LLPLGGNSEGNKITLYDTGDDAFRAMWAAIDNAKHRVWLETYILEPDHIGKRTINGLIKAAKAGCDVRLIYDYIGSSKLNSIHLQPLIAAGAQVVPFNPLLTWPWKILHWGFFRNHRKILVVDDTVAFTGGMNIGDQYASPKIGGNGYFRDTHVKVEGPAIADLAKVFLGSLAETGSKLPPEPKGMKF